VYISAERKFYNMKWSVDLGAINSEAVSIVERIAANIGSSKHGPGGLMLRLS
jgi:hypothetical protein